ncbi:MAG: hypothetical protein AB7G15_08470 [Alphaproteobacteria bacterium]
MQFLVLNVLHFRFLPVRVVLYDALADAALAALLTAVAVVSIRRWRRAMSGFEAALALLLGLALGANFAIGIPTTVDRSLSIYILEKLAQHGGAVRENALPRIFAEDYLVEHKLVDIRLTEQLNSGTIRIENGCVTLTPRGRTIARLTRLYRTELLPRRRDVRGHLTDALTDPFRDSRPRPDDLCPQ